MTKPKKHDELVFLPLGVMRGDSIGGHIKDGKYVVPVPAGIAAGNFRVAFYSPKKTTQSINRPVACGGWGGR